MKKSLTDHSEHVRTWLTTIVRDRIIGLARIADGGCWQWQGACNSRKGRKDRRAIPVMALPNRGRQGISVRRLAAQIAGKLLGPKDVVVPSCGQHLCVNPEHMRPTTRRQMVQEAVKRGAIRTGTLTSARQIEAARKLPHVKLTMEKARAMRERYVEVQSYKLVAQEFGVSHQHAHRVIRGVWWRESNPFSGLLNIGERNGRSAKGA